LSPDAVIEAKIGDLVEALGGSDVVADQDKHGGVARGRPLVWELGKEFVPPGRFS
jgi:hypothetical protein